MGRHSRNKKKNRELFPRFFIVCEGDKTEPRYFISYIEDKGYSKGKTAKVIIKDVGKNTAKELVREAAKLKEHKDDEIWVVFDKDGYTKHPEAFALAQRRNINIAFSSICFETWILMHFEYTTAAFLNYEELFKRKLKRYLPAYNKGYIGLYDEIKEKTDFAINNSIKLNIHSEKTNSTGTPLYQYNPYTNIPDIFKALEGF